MHLHANMQVLMHLKCAYERDLGVLKEQHSL